MKQEVGKKRWRVVVHLRSDTGAQCMEISVDRFAEIDDAVGAGAGQVISVHVVPADSTPRTREVTQQLLN